MDLFSKGVWVIMENNGITKVLKPGASCGSVNSGISACLKIILIISALSCAAMFFYPGKWIVRTNDYLEFSVAMAIILLPASYLSSTSKDLGLMKLVVFLSVVSTAYLACCLMVGVQRVIVAFPFLLSIFGVILSAIKIKETQSSLLFHGFLIMVVISFVCGLSVLNSQPELVYSNLTKYSFYEFTIRVLPAVAILYAGFHYSSQTRKNAYCRSTPCSVDSVDNLVNVDGEEFGSYIAKLEDANEHLMIAVISFMKKRQELNIVLRSLEKSGYGYAACHLDEVSLLLDKVFFAIEEGPMGAFVVVNDTFEIVKSSSSEINKELSNLSFEHNESNLTAFSILITLAVLSASINMKVKTNELMRLVVER